MQKYSSIYEIEYDISEDDYFHYNFIVYEESIKNKSRNQTLFGIFSAIVAGFLLSTLLITDEFQALLIVLNIVLTLFSIYSIIFYPLIFPSKLRESTIEIYRDKNINEIIVNLKISKSGITQEIKNKEEKSVFIPWERFKYIYIYDNYIIMMIDEKNSIVIPSKALKEQYDAELKSYIIFKSEENNKKIIYQK